jgi:hypothetical protein
LRPQTFPLREQRDKAFAIRAVTLADFGRVVTIADPKRTNEQNRRCWLCLSAIVKAGIRLDGMDFDPDEEDWYELLASAYLKQKRLETGKLVRGLEGEMLTLGQLRPSKFSVEQFGEYLIVIEHFMAIKNVELPPRPDVPPPPETDR